MRGLIVAYDVHQFQVVVGEEVFEDALAVQARVRVEGVRDCRDDASRALYPMVQIPRLEDDALLVAAIGVDDVRDAIAAGGRVPTTLALKVAVRRTHGGCVAPIEVRAEVARVLERRAQRRAEFMDALRGQVAILEQVVFGRVEVLLYSVLGSP